MTYTEILGKVEELERRNQANETALKAALKEIEALRSKSEHQPAERTIKAAVEPEIYNCLFDYGYDRITGEYKATGDRMQRNFINLYTNIMMSCGYVYKHQNSKDGHYYAKVLPLKSLSDSEYDRLCKLIRDITELIYNYKTEKEESEA